ncbi:MAG: leucine-rich repeat protein, partial [Lachnospiraceae bacterium]|nr:leucine-rich repeat protein [Lachnospiraceae bacterium]
MVYGNLKYKVVENEVTILGLSDNSPSEIHDLVIPDTIDGKPVTVISDNAFSFSDRLEGSLIIPNSVTTIGAEAFMSCELLKGDLIIPENVVTIGYEAFYGCQGFDGNLRIGSSVTVISQNAFWGCRNLSGDLFIPESVKTIDSCAFYGCTGLTGTLTIPESLSNIQDHSFYGLYGITRIINNSDHDLKVSQFWEDKDDDKMVCFRRSDGSEMNTKHGGILNKKSTYERKVLPTQIISGKKTLDVNIGTPLTVSVNLLPDNAYDRITWGSNNNNIATVSNGVVTGIGPGKAIITASVKNNYGQSYSETLTVNVKYRVSGDLIYKYSKDGDEVIILKHKDGENAAGELVIPESIDEKPVTVISDNAFKGCSGLTGGLTIPESVQVIGDNAFYGCTGLTGDLTIPGNVKIIGKEAFWNSGFDGKLTIEDGVKTISNMAFLQCSKFTEDLEIPDSVETIGNQAFEQCEGFDGSLKIGNSVETIGDRAFYLCPGFKGRLTIGNSVKTIGEHAFYGCNNFTGDLVIPDSVESIKTSAFEGWKNINGKLTIGTGVNWIDTDAFKGWYSVSGIIKKSAATANIDWFWDKDDDDTVCFVSDNGTEIHKGENIEAGTYVR